MRLDIGEGTKELLSAWRSEQQDHPGGPWMCPLSLTADREGFSCSHTSHLKHLGNHQFSWRVWSLASHKTRTETT